MSSVRSESFEGKITTSSTTTNSGVQPKFQEPWQEQKLRMDKMIDSLKRELKEVQTMDKHLTKQFIVLGGQINKLKTTSTFYDEVDDSFVEGDENIYDGNTDEVDQYDTKF